MSAPRWNRLTAAELTELAAGDAVVLLPIGATEQHGPHLPTGVDDFLTAEVCRRAAVLLNGSVVVAPSIPIGLTGQLSLTLPTLQALLRDICRSIIQAGFSRILIVNGHSGNETALNEITDARTALTNYFTVGRAVIRENLETEDSLTHAGEGETSMMLAALPDLVRTGDAAKGERLLDGCAAALALLILANPWSRTTAESRYPRLCQPGGT